jgi:hypothetical protein
VLTVFAQPRFASIIWSDEVKFFDASTLAKMPLLVPQIPSAGARTGGSSTKST